MFYTYGVFVHLLSITGVSVIEWQRAPLQCQALDVIYLVVDGSWSSVCRAVASGGNPVSWRCRKSDGALYSFSGLDTDVPGAFAPSPEQSFHLCMPVAYYVIPVTGFGVLVAFRTRRPAPKRR